MKKRGVLGLGKNPMVKFRARVQVGTIKSNNNNNNNDTNNNKKGHVGHKEGMCR